MLTPNFECLRYLELAAASGQPALVLTMPGDRFAPGVNRAKRRLVRLAIDRETRPIAIAPVEASEGNASQLAADAILARFRGRQREYDNASAEVSRALADLETEKADTVRAFKAATSDTMRSALEADMMRLDAEIAQTRAQHHEMELTETDLERYIADLTEILEHPSILLEKPADMRVQRSRYSRVFEPLPTLIEMEAGTAKLTPIFWVFEGQRDPESLLVRLRGLTWNQIHSEILRHENVYDSKGENPT